MPGRIPCTHARSLPGEWVEHPAIRAFALLLFSCVVILAPPICDGMEVTPQSDSQAPGQGQVEATVIHVDKYGVYVPNIVFYWDDKLPSKSLDSLLKTAEKLRNKKAIITYSSKGDLVLDKRPLLVDIIPSDEHTKHLTLADSAAAPEDTAHRQPADLSQFADDTEEDLQEEDVVVYSTSQSSSYGGLWDVDEEEEEEARPITREEVLKLVQSCLKATGRKDMDTLLSCYGNRVEYFSSGLVDRSYIREDKARYFGNWDRIETSLAGDVVLIVTDQHDMRIVKFESVFFVENRTRSIKGRAENVWKVKRVNGEVRIVGESQKILVRQ